jgi:aspartate aminotransferase
MLNVIRGIYSMPPNHGGAIVRMILNDPALTRQWQDELAQMRTRINGLRDQLATKLVERLDSDRFDFIRRQRGMFSFLGIDNAQIVELRERFSIYMVDSSRINVAGLNSHNIDYACDAIASII